MLDFLDNLPKATLTSLPLHRLVPSNQNSEITFPLLQMQSLPSPLPPLSVGRPAELLSLLQYCPPRRGSGFTLPSRFHPRSGDLQNANANGLLLPRLETCQRPPNSRLTLCESPISNYTSIPSAPKSTPLIVPRSFRGPTQWFRCHELDHKNGFSFACTDLFSSSVPILVSLQRSLVQSTARFCIGCCVSHVCSSGIFIYKQAPYTQYPFPISLLPVIAL